MAKATYEPIGMMDPQIFGLPVDRKTLFSNHKNIYKKRVEKRQRDLIVKIPSIKPFLKRGEKILVVTTGYSPLRNLAQLITAFFFVYLKRSVFVFTNYRIIHIPTTPDYRYKNSLAQIPYAGCRSISLKGGSLTVQYAKNGRSDKFGSIAVAERKKIRALLNKRPISGTKSQLAHRIHLCPRCTHRLSPGTYKCENCQLRFKSKIITRILSLMFPGGGYLYTGHYLLAFLNAILELFTVAYAAFIFQNTTTANNLQGNWVYLATPALAYLIIKIIAMTHSSHFVDEFIPTKKNIKPMTR